MIPHWDPDNGVYGIYTGPYLLVRTEENFVEFHLRYEWWAVDIGLMDRMPWPEAITNIAYPSEELGAQLIINDEFDYLAGYAPGNDQSHSRPGARSRHLLLRSQPALRLRRLVAHFGLSEQQ